MNVSQHEFLIFDLPSYPTLITTIAVVSISDTQNLLLDLLCLTVYLRTISSYNI
ncbi:hypothetical protein NUACC26_091740 [Scytonema sp. NUACC26]